MATFYDFTMKSIDGADKPMADYKGKVCLVVNVASRCGYTKHYSGMQALYEKYQDRGLKVLGFPSNQFAEEEPGSDAEIRQFCSSTYNVTFDMFSKSDVKDENINPLYAWLVEQPVEPGEIRWNFAKILVDRQGRVVGRWDPKMDPQHPEIVAAVEKALA
jgi:glutathione peroxidase